MSHELYDKAYGPETLKIIEGLLHDLEIWTGYHDDKYLDVVKNLQEMIVAFKRTIEVDDAN